MNLPLGFAQNRIWCAIVALAVEVTAWMQMLALTGAGNPNGCGADCSPSRPRSPPPAGRSGFTSRPRPPGPTWSTTPSTGYEPSRFRGRTHPPVPTTTARAPATWNRRPPETTLGPLSHPDPRTNPRRRPTAATTLAGRAMKDPG